MAAKSTEAADTPQYRRLQVGEKWREIACGCNVTITEISRKQEGEWHTVHFVRGDGTTGSDRIDSFREKLRFVPTTGE